jgi:hypothetical protein
MNYKTELSRRNYRAGYVLVKGIVDGEHYDCEDFTMTHAETPTGDYIGDSRTAYRLCKKRGIKPEKITPSSNVCSIGWCEKKKLWFGWSHRAIFGFGVGSSVKEGDCGYDEHGRGEWTARDSDDAKQMACDFAESVS